MFETCRCSRQRAWPGGQPDAAQLEIWENFPTTPATRQPRRHRHWLDEAVNHYAERLLGVIMACAPLFYAALFLAFLAVSFGIIW
jgi:hypothetical protein